jgi:hypothetical protein
VERGTRCLSASQFTQPSGAQSAEIKLELQKCGRLET